MASTILRSRLPLSPAQETEPLTLTDWGRRSGRLVSRESTISRRISASYIRGLRDDARSFRSNITISSTTSSPGYNHFISDTEMEIIDPSTYSFTSAIRVLQARSSNCWEMITRSPERPWLQSKWDEAERYISNPLSGEVPIACLSSRTLENTSVRTLSGRITMSAPLLYSSHSRQACPHPSLTHISHDQDQHHLHNVVKFPTRDVGTQSSSTPSELSSRDSSPMPAETEIIINKITDIDLKFDKDKMQVEVKDTIEEEEKGNSMEAKKSSNGSNNKTVMGRCFPWKCGLWVVCKLGQRGSGEEEQASCSSKRQIEKKKKKKKNSISVHNHAMGVVL